MAAGRWVTITIMVCVFGAWINILLTGEQKLPLKTANGNYYNACCGVIKLHDGSLEYGSYAIGYTVEYDKVGAYVLPKGFVATTGNRVDIDRGAYPSKLRLDRQSKPTQLEIMGRSDDTLQIFTRVNGS